MSVVFRLSKGLRLMYSVSCQLINYWFLGLFPGLTLVGFFNCTCCNKKTVTTLVTNFCSGTRHHILFVFCQHCHLFVITVEVYPLNHQTLICTCFVLFSSILVKFELQLNSGCCHHWSLLMFLCARWCMCFVDFSLCEPILLSSLLQFMSLAAAWWQQQVAVYG
jgi:hypothetical protein